MPGSYFRFVLALGAVPSVRGLLAALALVISGPSAATLITFEDLAPETQVTNQYESLGLIIDGGAITVWEGDPASSPVVSPSQVLYDFYGPNLYLYFVGVLPTTVSMYVTTVFGDIVSLSAYGSGGLVDHEVTEGWAGTEENSTAAIPREFVELFSPAGIQTVLLEAFYFRRGDLYIDNLSFTTTLPVSEPPVGTLVSLALLAGLAISARRRGLSHQ